ncbi:hypothetical protein PFISCL1PPCAC_8265, partial [Pristionchus fissidentatus]
LPNLFSYFREGTLVVQRPHELATESLAHSDYFPSTSFESIHHFGRSERRTVILGQSPLLGLNTGHQIGIRILVSNCSF